jgi:hypothetical protein
VEEDRRPKSEACLPAGRSEVRILKRSNLY